MILPPKNTGWAIVVAEQERHDSVLSKEISKEDSGEFSCFEVDQVLLYPRASRLL
jgi:hypothetical protein